MLTREGQRLNTDFISFISVHLLPSHCGADAGEGRLIEVLPCNLTLLSSLLHVSKTVTGEHFYNLSNHHQSVIIKECVSGIRSRILRHYQSLTPI